MLHQCTAINGGDTILSGLPSVASVSKALYVPNGIPEFGLFDWAGKRVPEGSLFRGIPYPQNISGSPVSSIEPSTVDRYAHGGPYVYLGKIEKHYGHFLVSTLSRLWHPAFKDAGYKILYTNTDSIDELFKLHHIAEIFGAFGLSPDRFMRFAGPVIIDHVLVPAPSYNENLNAYTVFGELCASLGKTISSGAETALASKAPIYLTKEKLAKGVQRLENESDVTRILSSFGVEIIAPELLSLKDQISIFRSGRPIMGYISSAFHTSIFAAPGRYLMLSHSHLMHSNQVMIDKLTGSKTLYMHALNGVVSSGKSDEFGANYRVVDPQGFAADLMTAIGCIDATSCKSGNLTPPQRSKDPLYRPKRPMGRNLSKTASTVRKIEGGNVITEIDLGDVYRISGVRITGKDGAVIAFHAAIDGEFVEFFKNPIAPAPHMFTCMSARFARKIRAIHSEAAGCVDLEVFGADMEAIDKAFP